jgi:3-isopropylmalate/(R)-2-methylmalate dehydratase large subunit
MEFTGPTIRSLPMDDRFTMCNMAIEAGAKSGIVQIDPVTSAYVVKRAKRPYATHYTDDDAEYRERHEIDVSKLSPQVAKPHLPENAVPVGELSSVGIDQAVIGSCTNGRLSDIEAAHEVLAGRKVAPSVRCIIIPATQEVYLESVRHGWVEDFIEAGCVFSTPTCGPCLGGHMGILAAGERAIATTNRNFVGRMGHPESEVYLANPSVAAASAVTGVITHPGEVIGD